MFLIRPFYFSCTQICEACLLSLIPKGSRRAAAAARGLARENGMASPLGAGLRAQRRDAWPVLCRSGRASGPPCHIAAHGQRESEPGLPFSRSDCSPPSSRQTRSKMPTWACPLPWSQLYIFPRPNDIYCGSAADPASELLHRCLGMVAQNHMIP